VGIEQPGTSLPLSIKIVELQGQSNARSWVKGVKIKIQITRELQVGFWGLGLRIDEFDV
jgi:hypothetical protein